MKLSAQGRFDWRSVIAVSVHVSVGVVSAGQPFIDLTVAVVVDFVALLNGIRIHQRVAVVTVIRCRKAVRIRIDRIPVIDVAIATVDGQTGISTRQHWRATHTSYVFVAAGHK